MQSDIGLVAAMQEEIRPLLRIVGRYQQESIGKQTVYRFTAGKHAVCLVQSGMGPTHATAATRLLIDTARPEIIINFGFAGALSPELKVGDIVLASRLLFLHERLFSEQQGLDQKTNTLCSELLRKGDPSIAHHAAFITTSRISSKKELVRLMPADIQQAVVEMETSAVAQVANKEGIPLIAIRAISDGAGEELGFSLDEFCNRELNLQIWRVLLSVVRKPWIIPQLVRLSRNSRHAGRCLSEAVSRILPALPL